MKQLICLLGHTAGGKTFVAAQLANRFKGEIISADSRQVYKHMDIGTGKDLSDYIVNGIKIPYHLIDIVEPGTKYNIFEYSKDFKIALNNIYNRNSLPILCGGSGLYIESAIKNYKMLEVPPNETLRDELKNKTLEELERVLKTYKKLHNKSDTDTPKRAIRAIEIAEYYAKFPPDNEDTDTINSIIFGIKYDREIRRQRITSRLHQRINEGMIEEGEQLHKMGLSYKDMEYYGLEYKYLSWFLQSKINKTEMVEKLNTAIHQFAKRQMTWFRKMERNGTPIHWINGELPIEDKLDIIENYIKKAPNK